MLARGGPHRLEQTGDERLRAGQVDVQELVRNLTRLEPVDPHAHPGRVAVELVELLAPALVLVYDREHGWRLLPAPPEWWWAELEA